MNEELTYSLLQAGDNVEKRGAYHPPPQQDIQYVVDRNRGIKQQYNMDRQLNNDVETKRIQPGGSAESLIVQRARFNRWKRNYFCWSITCCVIKRKEDAGWKTAQI